MKTFSDPNATHEFIGPNTVHVSFKASAIFTTHLLREIMVASKAQNGEAPKAIILSLHDGIDSDRFFKKISSKSHLIPSETLISLVCLSKVTFNAAQSYLGKNKPDYPVAVFSDFQRGLDWIEQKLMHSEKVHILPVNKINVGMTA